MSKILSAYKDIDLNRWDGLVQASSTATWFQTEVAYRFFASQPDLFEPFVLAVENERCLNGVVVGYITKDRNSLKQFFTRRAIVIGGPALSDNVNDEELFLLLDSLKNYLRGKAIYIETRNFNDYSKWRNVFETCGFCYESHLNFQVDCSDWNSVEENIGKHRKKYIRLSLRDGAAIIKNPSINQVREYYSILEFLYRTKVKTPLYSWRFFERLYNLQSSKFLLVEYNGHVIGGSVCMCLDGKGVYEWYACGKDGSYKNIHPSSVTKYAGMKYAAENGFKIFDMMGAGKPNEKYGVRDFKAEFGGKLVEHGRFKCILSPILYKIGVFGVNFIKKH